MMEGREIFKEPGVPEDKDTLKKREGISIEQQKRYREEYPEFYEILEKVDLPFLREKYKAIAEKSGINPDTLNFLGPESFSPVTEVREVFGRKSAGRGQYNVHKNIIDINWETLKGVHDNEERRWLLPFHIVKSLVHEETHVVSKGTCVWFNDYKDTYFSRQSGYHKIIPIEYSEEEKERGAAVFGPVVEISLAHFNEGVVEKLSQELLLDYIKHAHDKNFDAATGNKFLEWYKQNPELKSYQKEIVVVNSFVKLVSALADVPEEVAWRGIVRGLFEGEDIQNVELKKIFEDLAGTDVLEEISKMNGNEKMENLAKDIEKMVSKAKNGPSIVDRIRSLFSMK